MPLECPLCGLGADDGSPARRDLIATRQRQLSRLREWLAELESGRSDISHLRDSIQNMCGTCQMLMIAIASPADLPELLERIGKDIRELESSVGEYRRRVA